MPQPASVEVTPEVVVEKLRSAVASIDQAGDTPPGSALPQMTPAAVAGIDSRSTGSRPTLPVSDLIDTEVIEELIDVMGEDFSGLVRTYLGNSPNYLEQIRAAIDSGDVKAVVLPVHSLKSSSANVGATQLSDFAKQLEKLARHGSLPEVEAGYGPLVDHFRRAEAELRRLIGEQKSA